MRSGMRADKRPERVVLRADFRFERDEFRPERVDSGPHKADLVP